MLFLISLLNAIFPRTFSTENIYYFYIWLNTVLDTLDHLCSELSCSWVHYKLILDSQVSSNSKGMLVTSICFLACVALLIFIIVRVSRFRLRHLTKLEWVKFLSLVLLSLLIQTVFYLVNI